MIVNIMIVVLGFAVILVGGWLMTLHPEKFCDNPHCDCHYLDEEPEWDGSPHDCIVDEWGLCAICDAPMPEVKPNV